MNAVRRSTWYGLSTSTPTAGAATSTITTAAAASAPSAAKCVHGVPRHEQDGHERSPGRRARSRGPAARSRACAGISASSMMRLVVSRSVRRRMRSTTNADSARTSSTLPSSDGWKRKKGSSIARREPRAENAQREDEHDRADQQRRTARASTRAGASSRSGTAAASARCRRPRRPPAGRRSSSGCPGCRPRSPSRSCRCCGDEAERREQQQQVDAQRRATRRVAEVTHRRSWPRRVISRAPLRLPRARVLVDVEQRGDDLARHRRGRLGAEAAGLVGHGDHVLRVRVGRERHVPGLVRPAERPSPRCRSCRPPGSGSPRTPRSRCRPASLAAPKRPSRIAWRCAGSISTLRAVGASSSWSTRPSSPRSAGRGAGAPRLPPFATVA